MQRILATIAILAMAACGSAAQTGPKTTNPPLTTEQKVKDGGQKPPMQNDGLKLMVNILSFQLTMTPSPWTGDLLKNQGEDGKVTLRLVLQRKDTGAVMLIIPIKAENETAKSIAESQLKAAQDQGLAASALADEGKGRYAFTIDSAATDAKPTKTYFSVLPHPSTKDAFLIVVATTEPKDADAFFKDVRTIADSIGPIP
jgi:hypothetical protein